MNDPYAAIGRAVFMAQALESVLIPIFEFFKMKTDESYLVKTGGSISAGAYKIPIRNIIKALSEKGDIDPSLEMRLNEFVSDRNLLIHNWLVQNGWPAPEDSKGFKPIISLANRVESEGKQLTLFFTGYMIRLSRAYDSPEEMEHYNARFTNIFKRAHLDF